MMQPPCSSRRDGVEEQAGRLTVTHTVFGDPQVVAEVRSRLRKAGADDAALMLVEHASFDNPTVLEWLAGTLRTAGEDEYVAMLAEHLPAVGLFELFRRLEDQAGKFRFGREPDGSAAEP